MTTRKHFKQLVRARAEKTGESYAAALRHLRTQETEKPVAESKVLLSCSFCGKSQVEVGKLVAGPGVYICDACVALSAEIVAEPSEPPEVLSEPFTPEKQREIFLLVARGSAERIVSAERELQTLVGQLRELGVEWREIAEAVGISEDEARSRFASTA